MVTAGATTPAGVVESVDLNGDLRLATLVIGGTSYTRGYDALVTVMP